MINYSIMEQLTPDYVLIGLLTAQPCHGYQLLESFRKPAHLGRVWNLSSSQVYAVLKRLESKQWIVGQPAKTTDFPPRTDYHPTALGQEQFEAWLYESQPSASIRRIRVEFLSRLYLIRLLHRPSQPIIHAQKAACVAQQQQLAEQQAHATPGMERLSLDLQVTQLAAVQQWIERCELVPQTGED